MEPDALGDAELVARWQRLVDARGRVATPTGSSSTVQLSQLPASSVAPPTSPPARGRGWGVVAAVLAVGLLLWSVLARPAADPAGPFVDALLAADFVRLERLADEAEALDPEHPLPPLARGLSLLLMERGTEVLGQVRVAAERADGDGELDELARLGLAAIEDVDEPEPLLAAWNAALEEASDLELLTAAILLGGPWLPDDSMARLEEVVERFREAPLGYGLQAWYWLTEGELDEAEAALDRGLVVAPRSAWLLYQSGEVELLLGPTTAEGARMAFALRHARDLGMQGRLGDAAALLDRASRSRLRLATGRARCSASGCGRASASTWGTRRRRAGLWRRCGRWRCARSCTRTGPRSPRGWCVPRGCWRWRTATSRLHARRSRGWMRSTGATSWLRRASRSAGSCA